MVSAADIPLITYQPLAAFGVVVCPNCAPAKIYSIVDGPRDHPRVYQRARKDRLGDRSSRGAAQTRSRPLRSLGSLNAAASRAAAVPGRLAPLAWSARSTPRPRGDLQPLDGTAGPTGNRVSGPAPTLATFAGLPGAARRSKPQRPCLEMTSAWPPGMWMRRRGLLFTSAPDRHPDHTAPLLSQFQDPSPIPAARTSRKGEGALRFRPGVAPRGTGGEVGEERS